MKLKNVGLAVSIMALAACQKKDNTVPDANKVTMNITSPAFGQTFRNGDTVFIRAKVNYTGQMHGYEVKIIDTNSGFIVYDDAQHVHTDNFVIDDQWVCTTNKPMALKLMIIASIDHDGVNAKKELYLNVNP